MFVLVVAVPALLVVLLGYVLGYAVAQWVGEWAGDLFGTPIGTHVPEVVGWLTGLALLVAVVRVLWVRWRRRVERHQK